jgi:hypothetical protein
MQASVMLFKKVLLVAFFLCVFKSIKNFGFLAHTEHAPTNI